MTLSIKTKEKITICFLIIHLFNATGCGPSEADHGGEHQAVREAEPIPNKSPIAPATFLTCPQGTLLSYENFGSGFIDQYCLACHSKSKTEGFRGAAPHGTDFDTITEVQIFRTRILERTKAEAPNPMPPNRELPQIQRIVLHEWLNCGAPERNI